MHRYLKKKKNKAYKEKKNNKSKNFFFEIKNSSEQQKISSDPNLQKVLFVHDFFTNGQIKLFFLKFQ